jgi:hypothetical protein
MRPGIRLFALSSLLFGFIASAHAQDSGRVQGYGFWGSGATGNADYSTPTMHTGFGVEGFVSKRVAIGGELGYLTPWRSMANGIGLFSLNGSYNFHRNRKTSPFVTGG